MKDGIILIVDDKEVNRAILRDMFQDRYDILEAENGQEALELIEEHPKDIAVILLDIIMPVMNGFELLEILNYKDMMFYTPVVLITGDTSRESEKKGYDYGIADMVVKPFDPHVVRRRVYNIIELYAYKRQLESMVESQTAILVEQAEKLKQSNNQIIDTMSTIVEFRNLESGQHVNRIKLFTKKLAEKVAQKYPEYALDEQSIAIITSASAMHDVGKIVIPDSILLKPGRLTGEEFETMKTHTTKGCEIVNLVNGLESESYYKAGYEICRYHHERYDGRGYPEGLQGEDIPISAQIVSIADVYDALVSDRVYKKAFPKDEAFRMIVNGECGVFSERMIGCFYEVKDEFEELAKKHV